MPKTPPPKISMVRQLLLKYARSLGAKAQANQTAGRYLTAFVQSMSAMALAFFVMKGHLAAPIGTAATGVAVVGHLVIIPVWLRLAIALVAIGATHRLFKRDLPHLKYEILEREPEVESHPNLVADVRGAIQGDFSSSLKSFQSQLLRARQLGTSVSTQLRRR